jgi:CDP-diacylglycerol--glycerol-3-phosphate 3-phosphatidyltransferase
MPVGDWRNLPNVLTAIRIVGSPGLIGLALNQQPLALTVLLVLLVFTEWADGFLARRLHASSALGARLDTIADAVFYSCLLASLVLLRPEIIGRESTWITLAIISYGLSWLASLIKFRRLPSYHTWAAKWVWLAVGSGVACLLFGWSPWPFRVAMLCVTMANIEAVLITRVLGEVQVDVPSFWHARRRMKSKQ